MKKYLEILRRCPLFYGIDDDNLIKMLTCLGARITEFDKKYTIFAEGSPAKHIGIVLSGKAQIVQVDFYGNRSIVSDVKPTELFAEAFACAECTSLPISVVASEPCEIMLIECSHILHTCQNNCGFHQALIFNLMKDLATKNLRFHERIEITSKRSTREKLLSYLSEEAKRQNSSTFTIPFNRQQLADFLSVDRSAMSNELGKMRDEGLLQFERNRFELLLKEDI
jgi:CRP-like cAMP-binding protein